MDESTNEVRTPGGRVGARIASLVADTMVATRQRLASTTSDVAKEVFTSVTNEVSDEVRSALGPLFAKLASDPNIRPEVQPLLHHLANTRGQAFGWVGGQVAGAGISNGLGDLFAWLLEPVVQRLIATEPSGLVTPEQASMAGARGFISPADADWIARKRDIPSDQLAILTELNRSRPSPPDVGSLLNRGAVDETMARELLRVLGFNGQDIDYMLTLAKTPLTPQDAAAAWARSLVSPEFVHMAARSAGLTNEDGDVLMGLAGEPPAAMDVLLAWRRGIITEADVDRALIQGPIRNEWLPVIKSLFEQPLPVTEAASAVTQGHLPLDVAQGKAALSGINAEDFATIVKNSGLPPGIEFAAEAFNRGLITDEQYTAMFLESRIKNQYIELMKAMRENLPPADTARIAYRMGVADREWCINILAGHGFSRANAEVMLNLEDARARQGTKELSRAQILDLYEESVIDEDQTKGMLSGLGFDDTEIEYMIVLAQGRQVKRFVSALTTRVHNGYVAGLTTAEDAATTLDQAGVPGAARDQLLALWDLEKQALTAQLTPAQIVSAVKKGFLDRAAGKDRLVARGYSDDDAEILIKLSVGA